MKRNLIIVFLLSLSSLTVLSQDLKQSYKQYIEYCNETVTDSITEHGSIQLGKEVPIYGSCNEIVGYKRVSMDTVWDGYECKDYMDSFVGSLVSIRGNVFINDTLAFIPWRRGMRFNEACTISRKHICHVKREKPSSEGFYQWLYKEIAK